MVEIPSGSFLMGSSPEESVFRENETPQHRVDVSTFFLGRFPVTQAQWLAVMKELPPIDDEFRGESLPVVNVYLEKALEFCTRLSDLTGLEIRLPSEAEWEYACRAGTTTAFAFGETLSPQSANFACESSFVETKRLTPVGFFKAANAFGLYDMHGNVWEWCADVWHENYIGAPTDAIAWVENGDQGYCVQRGGAWNVRADRCRSAFRVADIAHNDEHIVGLRICLTKK